MSRSALVLLPPSKGKRDGGDGPAFGAVLEHAQPLHDARRAVAAAAMVAGAQLDDAGIVRVAGVRRTHVDDGRARLTGLDALPTLPAHRRYDGIVHANADLDALDPAEAAAEGCIVSALLGLVRLDEPVPAYRLEFPASLPELGGLATFWRREAADELRARTAGRPVWDLLPGEHARIWPRGVTDTIDHRPVAFQRPDGRAANAARTKVAKGRIAGWLLRHAGTVDLDAATLAEAIDPGEDWTLQADGAGLLAVDHR
ncbi:MAG: peroxide stress protein YaaA [Nitriliruptoraceae bacterium]|nr:peroxide stress protein YaaA [Nitriliruptoraceae bacterium]